MGNRNSKTSKSLERALRRMGRDLDKAREEINTLRNTVALLKFPDEQGCAQEPTTDQQLRMFAVSSVTSMLHGERSGSEIVAEANVVYQFLVPVRMRMESRQELPGVLEEDSEIKSGLTQDQLVAMAGAKGALDGRALTKDGWLWTGRQWVPGSVPPSTGTPRPTEPPTTQEIKRATEPPPQVLDPETRRGWNRTPRTSEDAPKMKAPARADLDEAPKD